VSGIHSQSSGFSRCKNYGWYEKIERDDEDLIKYFGGREKRKIILKLMVWSLLSFHIKLLYPVT